MVIHNKLVRDRIPEIIIKANKKPITKILDNNTYKLELIKKLAEEMAEYKSAESDEQAIEELADVMEVIYSLAKVHNSSLEEVEKVRQQKNIDRGSFEQKIFLIEVSDG